MPPVVMISAACRKCWKGAAGTIGLAVVFLSTAAAQAPMEKGRLGIPLAELTRLWTGDLSGMVERRTIRELTAFSRTLYFIDRGAPRGTAYDQGKLLEAVLNQELGTRHLTVNVQFVLVSRDELIPALLDGKGDVVMANLTVTPERAKIVDFASPWIAGVTKLSSPAPRRPPQLTRRSLR